MAGLVLFYLLIMNIAIWIFNLFQCPTSGFFLFYPEFMGILTPKKMIVSMPYFGLLSFLPYNTRRVYEDYKHSFNALLRASFFSTMPFVKVDVQKEIVSMPYFGLLSFLQCSSNPLHDFRRCVSMPYFGLLSFLHNEGKGDWYVLGIVSMPYFGLLSFLQLKENKRWIRKKFQCPTSGFFLFYAMLLQPLILLAFQPPVCK